MTFDVEVVLKGRDNATTEAVTVAQPEPSHWTDESVREVLVEMLRAIDRANDPATAASRAIVLQGFSWIIEPMDGMVVIAIEIPMGAAVAGPFAIGQAELESMVTRVLRMERQSVRPETIH